MTKTVPQSIQHEFKRILGQSWPMASFDLQVVLSIEHEVIQSEYKFS